MTMPGLHPDQDIAANVLTDVQLVRWVLREVRGFSIARIADAQHVSEAAVKESLREARRKITRAKQEAA